MNESLEQPKDYTVDPKTSYVQATCGKCGKPMHFNVPRMGPAGGFVHADTGQLLCDGKQYGDYFPSTERDELQRQLVESTLLCSVYEREAMNASRQLVAEREARELSDAKLANAVEAIGWLVDFQNGCPLPKYEENWNKAMTMCRAVLNGEPPALLKVVEQLRATNRELADSVVGWSQLVERTNAAEAKLKIATDALHTYGNHTAICRSTLGMGLSCDCGWREAMEKVSTPQP